MKSPADLINALDITGDDIFNGLDLVLLPLLIACGYYFVKKIVIEHNRR